MLWLRQNQARTFQFGPFVDKDDGVTPETGLATNMDNATTGIRISKNGAVMTDRDSGTAPVHDVDGYYRIELSATDTNALGTLHVEYEEAGVCLPAWKDFMVVPNNVWDSFFSTDRLQVDQIQIKGTTVPDPTTAGVPDVNVERWLDTLVTLTTALPDVNTKALASSIGAADAFGRWMTAAVNGTADSGTATTMVDDARGEADDHFLGYMIVFFAAGGGLRGARLVTDFDAAADRITFAPAMSSAITTEQYVLIPMPSVDVQSWLGTATGMSLVNALIAGRVDSSVGAMAANVLNAAAINSAAITAAKFATDAIDANVLAAAAVNKIADALLPEANIALANIPFLFVAASDHVTVVTGASGMAVTRSIDSAAFAAGTGTIAEVGDGIYQYDASAADMNGGKITFRFIATGGTPGAPDDSFVSIITRTGT